MQHDWITVQGTILQGHQVASGQSRSSPYPQGTITLQLPFFQQLGLDLTAYFHGTLNISIAPATFFITAPAHVFRSVSWTTRHPPEDFSFARCQITVAGQTYPAWVYYPHPETKQSHFQDPSTIEIIAPRIPNLQYGNQVTLALPSDEITISR